MKKLLTYVPFHFLICLIFGIFFQFYTRLWNDFYTLPIFISLFTFLYFFKTYSRKAFSLTTLLFFIFIGMFVTHINNPKNHASFYLNNTTNNAKTVLKITKKLKPGNYYYKYIAAVTQVNTKKTCGTILINIKKDSNLVNLSIDDQLLITKKFKSLINPLNPYQFNYKCYLEKQYIYHQIFINQYEYKKLKESATSLYGLAATFRKTIQNSLKEHHFTEDQYAVINALLLGQRQDISKSLLSSYTKAGAIHILAISGLHIGIILLILSQLFKPLERLKYGNTIKVLLIVLLLWMFAFVAGLSASVTRAVTMFTFIAIGASFKRKKVIEYSLISSMLFLLLIKPMFLFDVGFQLSYLAVFGIIWVQPFLYNLWEPKLFLTDYFWRLLTVSVAAQAGILPISLYYFHQFPGLFMLSNLIIIPFLGAILIGGIIIITTALLNILPNTIANIYGEIISLMNAVVNWIAHQEDYLLKEISMSFYEMLAWYCVITCIYQLFIYKTVKQVMRFLVAIILLQTVLIIEKNSVREKQEFIVFHKSRSSLLGIREKKTLTLLNTSDTIIQNAKKILSAYRINQQVKSSLLKRKVAVFTINNTDVLIIDSLGVYNIPVKNPIVILQHSPKINLTRMIQFLNPTQIIADGSNYKSYINRWQLTCKKQKTPFHYTGQNGAFILDRKD